MFVCVCISVCDFVCLCKRLCVYVYRCERVKLSEWVAYPVSLHVYVYV